MVVALVILRYHLVVTISALLRSSGRRIDGGGGANLAHQTEVYAKANDTNNRFSIVLYVNEREYRQTMEIIRENKLALGMEIVLIDASPRKVSASKIDAALDFDLPGIDLPGFDFSGGEFQ